jgi:hypothetical protein
VTPDEGEAMLLGAFTFWDVFWLLILASVWLTIAAFVLIVLIDNFRRTDQSGWAKAGWTLLVIAFPLLGAIVYQIARPTSVFSEEEWDSDRMTAARSEALEQRMRGPGPR